MPNKRNRKRKVDAKGRNKHGGFVQLDHYMLKSPAYRLLTPAARALLVEFIHLFNGRNNGELFMSQRDAAKAVGLKTHQTAGKYIDELVRRGFLEVVCKGSFDNKTQLASIYRLTMKTNDDDKGGASKEFMRIPLTDEEKTRVENMTPSWWIKRPPGIKSLPVGFADALKDSTRRSKIGDASGEEDCTTYNIPGDVGNDDSEASETEAA